MFNLCRVWVAAQEDIITLDLLERLRLQNSKNVTENAAPTSFALIRCLSQRHLPLLEQLIFAGAGDLVLRQVKSGSLLTNERCWHYLDQTSLSIAFLLLLLQSLGYKLKTSNTN